LTDEHNAQIEFFELIHSGIPPAPSIIFTNDSETWTDKEGNEQTNEKTKPIACIGTECFNDLLPDTPPIVRTFWRDNH